MAEQFSISELEISKFWSDGAICLRQVIDPTWISRLREAVDECIRSPGPLHKNRTSSNSRGLFFVDFQLWQRWDVCREFVTQSNLARWIARLLDSQRIFFYHDHLIVKEIGATDRTPWHHDQPYYPLEGRQICSIWLPLDPVDRETCVKYVKGSHQWGKWFAPQYFNSGSSELQVADPRFEPVPDFDSMSDQVEFLSWDMEPGDCIAFHALTVHGASGNHSTTRRRRAWATRWCGDDVRYAHRLGEISPPLLDHSLKPGDALGCTLFPQVWP